MPKPASMSGRRSAPKEGGTLKPDLAVPPSFAYTRGMFWEVTLWREPLTSMLLRLVFSESAEARADTLKDAIENG